MYVYTYIFAFVEMVDCIVKPTISTNGSENWVDHDVHPQNSHQMAGKDEVLNHQIWV